MVLNTVRSTVDCFVPYNASIYKCHVHRDLSLSDQLWKCSHATLFWLVPQTPHAHVDVYPYIHCVDLTSQMIELSMIYGVTQR